MKKLKSWAKNFPKLRTSYEDVAAENLSSDCLKGQQHSSHAENKTELFYLQDPLLIQIFMKLVEYFSVWILWEEV